MLKKNYHINYTNNMEKLFSNEKFWLTADNLILFFEIFA